MPRKGSRKRKAELDHGCVVIWPVAQAEKHLVCHSDSPSDEQMSISYTVAPRGKWENLPEYSTLTHQNTDFSLGDYVYINRQTYPPPPPPESASQEEIFEYLKNNTWVGKIQEVKGFPHEVLVRVFWLYWPEDLPNTGRQPHHGQQEMVLSNHPDIIDATTISDKAVVSFWNEYDDTDVPIAGDLFYRSTLCYTQNGKSVISAVRPHCTCKSGHNPDSTMYRCNSSTCGLWNHDHCLQENLRQELDKQIRENNLTRYLDERVAAWKREKDETRSTWDRIAAGAGQIVHSALNVMQEIEGNNSTLEKTDEEFDAVAALTPSKTREKLKPKSPSKLPTRTPSKTPVKGSLEAPEQDSIPSIQDGQIRISIKQEGVKKSVVAVVTLMPSVALDELASTVQEWEIRLQCLKCKSALD